MSKGLKLEKDHGRKQVVRTLILLGLLFSWQAAAADTYTVRNDKELESVLAKTDPDKHIVFIDNVIVDDPQTFTINSGDKVFIDLDRYNFQGNGAVYFKGEGAVTIEGSTTAFNGGLHVHDKINLTYDGKYSQSGVDYLGKTVGDDVVVNITTPGSEWNGSVLPGPFVDTLGDVRDGTLIIGDAGKATMNVTNGNVAKNSETILGAQSTGEGILNLTRESNWYSSGSFYVGFEGKGTLNVFEQAQIQTGSIVVGKEAGSDGVMNISGEGTVVNLYGRKDDNLLMSEGDGVMHVTDGARINFDESATKLGDLSGYNPKLGLGAGASTVDDSTIFGAVEGRVGRIIGDQNGVLNDNSLTFKNNAVLQGSLEISMGENRFNTGSIITPGLGHYGHHVGFGRLAFTNDTFVHESTAATYIDFDVHGDLNCVPPVVYDDGYLGNAGRDLIEIVGDARLAGDIYFRPQSGYYSDNIDVDFMHVTGTIDGQYERVHVIPKRWFDVPTLVKKADGNHLVMDRNTTPFTDAANSANLYGVGGALDEIYNAQTSKEWLEVLDWMWMMEDDEFRHAMRQLAGETRASSFLMPVRSPWRFVFDRPELSGIYRSRQDDRDCDAVYYSAPRTNSRNALWATPFYDYLRVGDDGNASPTTNSRVGFMTGYDRALSYRSSLGFVFAYSHPELKQSSSRVSADDYLFGLHYNTTIRDRFELKLWGSYGTQGYRMHRRLSMPDRSDYFRSEYTGNTVALSSQVAMPIKWRKVILRPLAALDLNYVQQNAASEKPQNSFQEAIGLHYKNSDWTQLLGRIGVKADYATRRWDFNASASFSYLLAGDEAPTVQNRFLIGGSAFDIAGSNRGRSFFNIGLGGQRWLNKQKTRMLFVQYNGEYGDDNNAQTAALGYQVVF